MSIYEEVEIEDLDYDSTEQLYTYPCPCGDKFRITLEELWDGEDIARCPSCTLQIMVVYDEEDLPELTEDEDDSEEEEENEKAVKETQVEKKLVEATKKSLAVSG
uniref:Diphthamide biosynthesis protein 3 n=1 Tax=Pseudictyota dubia TaxID=2749911 RepID=A0A7R9VMJ4_9STRA|mmetsp:Transcript_17427/g.32455  ORF Transcript_17427/g.32455 Transcript_17427/m.32455 type:complete len:105 (+) Transcript_17427:193-507(+)|eukprot:CAMPEP_0197436046 /NCGR_PEP_ID=MMETSP1175-20131217/3519_1 /TAXON_ID=1003142 /ORGANISM="Triceratium dubium, Strain CCMP147" /LENGTH=104 /DNA_ID=CAMNT_0042965227 /DNA_START=186 /DNA_END=500 /DNA_ORIENTATION=-